MSARAFALRGPAILIAALALVPPPAAAGGVEGAGTTAANFLTLGAGGAAAGMGGATLALGGDLASATWNPASLCALGATQFAFSHAELPDQSRQEWAAVAGTMGGPRWRWGLAGTFADQGSFDGRDAANQPTGEFRASNAAIGASVARALGAGASAGITARWVSETLAGTSGSGFGFDAGIQLRRGPLGFGAGAQNVGGRMRYGSASYALPGNWGAGLSYRHPAGVSLALDLNFPHAYYHDVRAGIEYRWRESVALRAGYRHELASDPASEPLDGPSFGIGAGARGLWLDYAYLPSMLGDGEHRLAVSFVPSKAGLAGSLGHAE